ncbi:unnamed protein product [Cochlearia groenlandica]
MGDQGVQPMQQPVVVYPNAYTIQYNNPPSSSSSSSSGSRGSFGTVFIVVAVILVLSAIACVFGRLCSCESRAAKRQHRKHEKRSFMKSREIQPLEREAKERGDMEFGFDHMRRPEPIEKPSEREGEEDMEFGFDNNRGGPSLPQAIKHGVRFKLPEDGDYHHANGDIRHGGPNFEFRQGH